MPREELYEVLMTEAENERAEATREKFLADYDRYLPKKGIQDIATFIQNLIDTLEYYEINTDRITINVYIDNDYDGIVEEIMNATVDTHREVEVIEVDFDYSNNLININCWRV